MAVTSMSPIANFTNGEPNSEQFVAPVGDFPAIQQMVYGHRLAYLDSAATTQKPSAVIEAESDFYRHDNANVHRGVHALSMRATMAFDSTRETLADWINAPTSDSIIFTKGCTESVNLVAHSWGLENLKPGDRVLVSHMEHHANIVPWQLVCQRTGATLEPFPITDGGEVDLEKLATMLDERVKLVCCVHISNSLGTINPVAEIARMAHAVGAKVLFDGAQALTHLRVDVQAIDADFYTISSHKMYGPTGCGALYVRPSILEKMPPFLGGGDMIRSVSFEHTTFADGPSRFEAGTPNIAGIVAWKSAFEYLSKFNLDEVARYERGLAADLEAGLSEIPGIRIVGQAREKAGIVSFACDWGHPHDLGTILDQQGVAIRAGHHCCMPLMKRLCVNSTARASFALYSTPDDVSQCLAAVQRARELLA